MHAGNGLWWRVSSEVDGARLLLGAFAKQFAQSEYWCFVTLCYRATVGFVMSVRVE
jgi:hypothetical protein